MVSMSTGSVMLLAQRDCLAVRTLLAKASRSYMGSFDISNDVADDARLGAEPCQITGVTVALWPRRAPLQR
jgi:hypothetical protein